MIDGGKPSAKYKRKILPWTLDSLPFPSTVLGAQGWDVLGLVMKQGAGMVAIGVAAGLVTAFALTRLMASLLFGVTTYLHAARPAWIQSERCGTSKSWLFQSHNEG